MDRRGLLRAVLGAALCPLCVPRGFAAERTPWSYQDPGPPHWGGVCATGSQQSPLDIADAVAAELPALEIAWPKRPDTIENNGHTIQLNFSPGNTLRLGERPFGLVQFHFHRPSEHLIGGRSFPMEVHFVHRQSETSLAVLGVLMAAGAANATFARIVATMPGAKESSAPADPAIDPDALLPTGRGYYRYEGSLTTPPCSEVVDWLLLTEPVQVAEADIAAFARLYPNNARPAQEANRRFVLRSP